MNVFMLDHDMAKSARYNVDSHIVKIPLEAAQLLSTAVRLTRGVDHKFVHKYYPGQCDWTTKLLPGEVPVWVDNGPGYFRESKRSPLSYWSIDNRQAYLISHINHPWNLWTRESIENYNWLLEFTEVMGREWTSRFNHGSRVHASVLTALNLPTPDLPSKGYITEQPQCFREDLRVEGDPVQGYRNYYFYDKKHLARWKHGEVPDWYSEMLSSANC